MKAKVIHPEIISCDNEGELKTALAREIGGTANGWQEQFGYNYDGAGNLYQRTNCTLLKNYGVNNLNELAALTNSGQLTVTGAKTSPAANVTVNSLASALTLDPIQVSAGLNLYVYTGNLVPHYNVPFGLQIYPTAQTPPQAAYNDTFSPNSTVNGNAPPSTVTSPVPPAK